MNDQVAHLREALFEREVACQFAKVARLPGHRVAFGGMRLHARRAAWHAILTGIPLKQVWRDVQ